MSWKIKTIPEADKDLTQLDGSQRKLVRKAVMRVSQNPLPASRGGYGKPLGNKTGLNLTGFLKIKLKGAGLRVVYRVLEDDTVMVVVVVGDREDEEVYREAARRLKAHPELK